MFNFYDMDIIQIKNNCLLKYSILNEKNARSSKWNSF